MYLIPNLSAESRYVIINLHEFCARLYGSGQDSRRVQITKQQQFYYTFFHYQLLAFHLSISLRNIEYFL